MDHIGALSWVLSQDILWRELLKLFWSLERKHAARVAMFIHVVLVHLKVFKDFGVTSDHGKANHDHV